MTRFRTEAAVSVSLAAALLWWRFGGLAAVSPGWLVAKFATVAVLALLAVSMRQRVAGSRLVATALGLHALGDVLIERRFELGLGAFLAGHLVWIALFWRHRRSLDELHGGRKLALGALAITAALVLAVLVPRLPAGPLAIAVPGYVAVLVLMAGSAWLARPAQPWLEVGGSLFVLSDALLGLREFAGLGGVGVVVWPLYVAAQLNLALGWLGRGPGAGTGDRNIRDDQSV